MTDEQVWRKGPVTLLFKVGRNGDLNACNFERVRELGMWVAPQELIDQGWERVK